MSSDGVYQALRHRIRQMEHIKVAVAGVFDDFLNSHHGAEFVWDESNSIPDKKSTSTTLRFHTSRSNTDATATLTVTVSASGHVEISVMERVLNEDGWSVHEDEGALSFQPDDNPHYVAASVLVLSTRVGEWTIRPQLHAFLEEQMVGARSFPNSPNSGPDFEAPT